MSYRAAARDLLRTTLLDAALELLRERAWSDITMADVAAAAGISRQTLYSEFGSRGEFAQAAVAREGERFLAAAAENPLVQAIVAPDGDGALLPLVTTQGAPLVEGVGAHLTGILVATWPQFTPREARALADCLVRLAISHAALPGGPPPRTAADVASILGPYVDSLVGPPAQARG